MSVSKPLSKGKKNNTYLHRVIKKTDNKTKHKYSIKSKELLTNKNNKTKPGEVNKPKLVDKPKVGIIGAGMGGLALALLLSHNGFEVSVYDKNSEVGGKVATVKSQKGFNFDIGPSLITMPFVFEKLFSLSGLQMTDYLKLKKLKVNSKYFFHDKKSVSFYSDLDNLNDEIKSNLLITREQLTKYFLYTEKIYNLAAPNFIYNSIQFQNILKPKYFTRILDLDVFRTMAKANAFYFKDNDYMQKILNRYATYSGSSPFLAPATLNLVFYIENVFGGYYIKQGMGQLPIIVKELCKTAKTKFFLNHSVETIITSNGRVVGIQVKDSKTHEVREDSFDVVISNVDSHHTRTMLYGKKQNIFNLKKFFVTPSSSAIIYLWGIKGIHKDLDIHNIFFSKDYKLEFNEIFKQGSLPSDPTVYVNISSKYNSSDAPRGYENWFVMVNTPPVELGKSNRDWKKDAKEYRKVVISKLISILGYDIAKRIVFEKIITPVDIEKNTNAFRGSIYGQSSNGMFADLLRTPNKHFRIKGLYQVGGTVHPGGGLPMVTLSAMNVYKEILSDLQKSL